MGTRGSPHRWRAERGRSGGWRGYRGLGRSGRSRSSMQALLVFRATWDVIGTAVAIVNLRGIAKRIAKVASRGRWCGPHDTSGQGCR